MSVWQEIKEKLSVEDIIGEYITIKNKGGGNFSGCCPFHNEKTPSLVASSYKQIWHCFGCGVGGDIFTFVEMIENCTSQEALQKLAKKASVQIDTKPQKVHKNDIKGGDGLSKNDKKRLLLSWVQEVYHTYLQKELQNPDSEVTKYCIQRGLTKEIISTFKLGFAPPANVLYTLVGGDKEKIELLKELGLLA